MEKVKKKKRIIVKAPSRPSRTKRKTSKKESGVLKPAVSSWLAILLILELLVGVFLISPIPLIKKAQTANFPAGLTGRIAGIDFIPQI